MCRYEIVFDSFKGLCNQYGVAGVNSRKWVDVPLAQMGHCTFTPNPLFSRESVISPQLMLFEKNNDKGFFPMKKVIFMCSESS